MASPFANVKFDNSLGAMLVGLIVSSALFGLTTLQTYMYYVNYGKDRAAFKWLVGVLWVLDLVHSIFLSHSTYYFLVKEYGNPAALLRGEWSVIMEVGVTIVVTVLVQWFFAHRVYKLTHNNYILAGVIVFLSLTHAALGVVSIVRLFQIKVFSRLPEVLGIMSATLIIMAANDVLITGILCWFLMKAQSTFNETQSAIRLLIVYTIETGLITSIFVTVDAICILTMPKNWIFIGITFCVSKLYANSLLTILNARHSLQHHNGTSNKVSGTSGRQSRVISSLRMQDLSVHSMNKSQELLPVDSTVKRETELGSVHRPPQLGYAV